MKYSRGTLNANVRFFLPITLLDKLGPYHYPLGSQLSSDPTSIQNY